MKREAWAQMSPSRSGRVHILPVRSDLGLDGVFLSRFHFLPAILLFHPDLLLLSYPPTPFSLFLNFKLTSLPHLWLFSIFS